MRSYGRIMAGLAINPSVPLQSSVPASRELDQSSTQDSSATPQRLFGIPRSRPTSRTSKKLRIWVLLSHDHQAPAHPSGYICCFGTARPDLRESERLTSAGIRQPRFNCYLLISAV